MNDLTTETQPELLTISPEDIQTGDWGTFGMAKEVFVGRIYVTVTNTIGKKHKLTVDQEVTVSREVPTQAARQAIRERKALDSLQAILDDHRSDSYAKKVAHLTDKIADFALKPGHSDYILEYAGQLTELAVQRHTIAVFVDEVDSNPDEDLIASAREALRQINTYVLEQVMWTKPFSRSSSATANLYGDAERHQLAKFSNKLQNILNRLDN